MLAYSVAIFVVIVLPTLAWLAITRKRDVTLNLSWLGAKVHLEAKGDSRKPG